MATPTSLANQMPIRNQQAATGIKQANDMGIQAISGTLAAQPNITRASQQAGAALAADTGQKQVVQAQQQASQVGQIQQQAVQGAANTAQNDLAARKIAIDNQSLTNAQKLGTLSTDLKDKLFDANLQFKKDEQGRTLFNDRQLCDWAKTKACSQEEFKNYSQQAMQTYERKAQVLQTAHNRIMQAISQEMKKGIQDYNQAAMAHMTEQKMALEEYMKEHSAAKAEAQAKWGAVMGAGGAVIGAIGGTYAGGNTAAGAMAGGTIGTSAGTNYGTQIEGV